MLLVLPADPAPGGQGLQSFVENVANAVRPGKCFLLRLELESWRDEPEKGSKDISGCKSCLPMTAVG